MGLLRLVCFFMLCLCLLFSFPCWGSSGLAERVSAGQRLKLQNVAEVEVKRYAHDHALWHKHIHNVELDPVQILKCLEMDKYPNTIDYSCRRTGKTAIKELYELKQNSCNADQELGIVAPREAQSLVNLSYHLEAIDRSEILSSYIGFLSFTAKAMSEVSMHLLLMTVVFNVVFLAIAAVQGTMR